MLQSISTCPSSFLARGIARQRAIHRYRDILVLEQRFEFPVTLSSYARSYLDLRAVREITGLCSLIGMDISGVEKALMRSRHGYHPSGACSQGDLMSTRPPTLRENRRYILVWVEPAGTVIDQKDLYYAISDAITSLWGDVMAAVIMQAVVAAEGQVFIIRCRRGTEQELAIALSTVTTCRDTRIALRIVAASGTIESLRERIRNAKTPDQEQVALHGNAFLTKKCSWLAM